jgi:H(+)-translocating pyrophosphatase
MGADLFGSLAESTCAALVVSSTCWEIVKTPDAMYFPLIITGCGICVSFVTIWFAHLECFGDSYTVDKRLFWQVVISTLFMTGAIIPPIYMLPDTMDMVFGGKDYTATPWKIFGCIAMGLWSGLIIGGSTEYYTSNSYSPTQDIARSTKYGPAPVIIKGLALGYLSNIIPICCLSATILVAFEFAAMYGVAMAAIGMLGVLPIALAIDGYGPISDNAGGIAEMSGLEEVVRERTDELDAAGNTTAAIGKGFAIGSACLVALALFGAFITRVTEDNKAAGKEAVTIDILNPMCFAGLLFGAMLPYWFSALTMSAVGDAAESMIEEIVSQEATIMAGGAPDHEKCIAISTQASLTKMIAPGCIVIISPLLCGFVFGYQALAGLLAGIIVSGIQIAFSASNTGGSWDNCKKFVEGKKLSLDDGKTFIKKKMTVIQLIDGEQVEVTTSTPEHAAAVVGDTVGDPLKDTSGPSINILIKLSAITSLVFGSFIAKDGGKLFETKAKSE